MENNIRPNYPHRRTNINSSAQDIENNIRHGHRNLALLLPCDPGDCDRQQEEKEAFVLSLFGLPAKRTSIRRMANYVNNLGDQVTPTEIVVTTVSQFRRMRRRYLASIDGGNPLTLSDVTNTLAPVRSVTKYLHDLPLRFCTPVDPRLPRLEFNAGHHSVRILHIVDEDVSSRIDKLIESMTSLQVTSDAAEEKQIPEYEAHA